MVANTRILYRLMAPLDWLTRNRLMKFAFVDQVVASGGNFLAAILLARALGIYELGRFALAWMLIELVATLQYAAILQPMLNIGPKQAETGARRYYQAVLVQQAGACALLGSAVAAGAIGLGWLLSLPRLAEMALPLGGAIATYQFYEFFRRYMFARGRPGAGLWIDLLRFGLQLAAILALPYAWSDPTAEAGIWIAAAACAAAAVEGLRLFGRIEWSGTAVRSVLMRHWEFSKWLLPSAVMFWTSSQAFIAIAGLTLGAAATGSLRAAITITGILNILLLSLNNFAPVQASHALHAGGPLELRRYIGRLAVFSASLIVAAVTLLNIAPDFVVHLLYGDQYEGVGELVRLLCGPAAVHGIGAVLVIWAAALERTRLIFWSYAVATPISIIAAFPLVKYGGVTGLVFCSLLVEGIRVALLLIPLVGWSRRLDATSRRSAPLRGNSAA